MKRFIFNVWKENSHHPFAAKTKSLASISTAISGNVEFTRRMRAAKRK